ncbi:hypothetical protein EJ04DRAFT_563154 [Polyplosphaeria fusca]|uniref:Rhodopsin domain-containing protein n=1 Tax=Polyplosphaeria fusca TaxID=682080 RepID=A0A9P4V3Y6_9PLEO|nr:hypothetical protein EJ04DRAFT_563154 [Polyplosphaeria fusca]
MDARTRGTGPFASYRSRVILGIVIALTITSTLSIVLRFVGKRIKQTKFCYEDVLIIAAQVVIYGLAVVTLLEVILGNAGHRAAEDPAKVPQALKILIPVQCLYGASLALIKISICVFYNRIFDSRRFHIASWTVIILVLAWASGAILHALLECRPLAFAWNSGIDGGHCASDRIKPWVVIGALDVVIDFMILCLPLPMLWNLRVSLADRIALFCIFGAGISTMIISVLRVEALKRVSFNDVTFSGSNALIWSFLEPSVGVTVACAPFFRPIFHSNFHRTFPDSSIEMRPRSPHLRRLRSRAGSVPSFVNPNFEVKRGIGTRGPYIAMQFQESGNWSQASLNRADDNTRVFDRIS